jgi:predicted subunit of tRNA(5-methylaminomethyl-2-thiouridylate) methyltransferase
MEPVRTTTFHGSALTRYEVSRTGRGVRLFGYFSDTGNRRMDRLALRHFGISYGGTGMFANGDYEHELQQAVRLRGGEVTALFPRNHHQPLISASSGVKKYE